MKYICNLSVSIIICIYIAVLQIIDMQAIFKTRKVDLFIFICAQIMEK